MDFERWFRERTSRFERLLLVSAVSLLALLVVSQALLTQPRIRQMLSLVDRLEGTPYEPEQPTGALPQPSTESHSLELEVLSGDARGLDIRVNGEVVTTFGQGGSVVLTVRDGDFVEIDGDLPREEVQIRVTEISEGMIFPARGQIVTYFGRPESVSWVVIGGN
jgi:hypothetical protein